jgi:hypothetical protein
MDSQRNTINVKYKGKTIRMTGPGGPWGSKISKLPHYLDNRPTDGAVDVGLMLRPTSSILVLISVRS